MSGGADDDDEYGNENGDNDNNDDDDNGEDDNDEDGDDDQMIIVFREGWDPLCKFLRLEPPDGDFPRCKKSSSNYLSQIKLHSAKFHLPLFAEI